MRIFDLLKYPDKKKRNEFFIPGDAEGALVPDAGMNISGDVSDNREVMSKIFRSAVNTDIVIRDFQTSDGISGFIIYIDGMVRSDSVNEYVLKPLFLCQKPQSFDELKSIVQINSVSEAKTYSDAEKAVLMGDTAVCIDGCTSMLTCETKGFDRRSVGSPENESTIKGSKEAFTESIRTNTTLIRKIITKLRITLVISSILNIALNTIII